MIIILKPGATKKDADEIIGRIASLGLKPLYMPGTERTVLGAIGDERVLGTLHIENHPLVERVSPVLTPYKLVSREIHPRDTVVRIGQGARGRAAFHGDRRTLRGGRLPSDASHGPGRETGRRQMPARRSLQAPDESVQLSGAGTGGPPDSP
jgi:hypothetical protein